MLRRTVTASAHAVAVAAAALGAAALVVVLAPARDALAYGCATHSWLAEQEAPRLAAADPSLAFLVTDPHANACFRYGAMFPDIRSMARGGLAGFDTLKQQLEGSGFVDSVRFATDEVQAAFADFDTHGCAFLLFLVDRGRASGDRYTHAFALGCLAHVMLDKHSQIFDVPWRTQTLHCGDLGVEPAEDPAALSGWYPGVENELVMEGFADTVRSAATLAFAKDAPWILAATPSASYLRALALRRFFFEAADAHCRQVGRTPPTELGIQNAAVLYELGMNFYPFFAGEETVADAGRTFVERFLDLTWWAAALHNVVQAILGNLLNGRDLFDLVGPLVPMSYLGRQIGGQSVLAEALFAFAQGGSEVQRVRTKFAQNQEFQRLDASGLLDPSAYATADYETAHLFVEDGILRGSASPLTDDVVWPRFSRPVMRAAGLRSLARASGADGVADAPALLLWDLRYVDPATGAEYPREVALPGDAGRTVRVEVELFGGRAADPAPIARIVRVRLRADLGLGAGDPVLGAETALIPADALDPRAYARRARPVVAPEWVVADVPGALGAYVEVDERRLAPVPDEAAVDRLLSTNLAPLAPLMTGRVHYDRYYATYGVDVGSLEFRR